MRQREIERELRKRYSEELSGHGGNGILAAGFARVSAKYLAELQRKGASK